MEYITSTRSIELNTHETRQKANALLGQAETALAGGNVEEFERMIADAQAKMAEADKIDQAASQLKILKGEFSRRQGHRGIRPERHRRDQQGVV